MPLRDHFRPPVSRQTSWEGFHGMWPATIVQQLSTELPPGFTAEPRAHLGSYFEIDVCAYEDDRGPAVSASPSNEGGATQTWSPPAPTLTLDTDLGEQYDYEVLVYDQSRGRTLVAAVEIVSPANKDRAENRRALVAKCAALLQQRVCVSIVDLVTTRQFNLYADLLELMGESDPAFERRRRSTPPPVAGENSASGRGSKSGRTRLPLAARFRRCRFGLRTTVPFRLTWKQVTRQPAGRCG